MHTLGVEWLIGMRPEYGREERGLDQPEHDVAVGDGERTATPVGSRTGCGAGGIGADPVLHAIKLADGAPASGDGVDLHHRRANAGAGDFRLEGAFELAVVMRDIGRSAAHVETDHSLEAGHRSGAHGSHDAAGRAGQDGILAAEQVGLRQPAVRLHEQQPHIAQCFGNPVHIAAQHGREIGIYDRGVATADDLHYRGNLGTRGYLREADLARHFGDRALVSGMVVGVHQHYGQGTVPFVVSVL